MLSDKEHSGGPLASQEVMKITSKTRHRRPAGPDAATTPNASLAGLDPATRERIEQTVLEIFSEREFHRVGLIEIARGANVSLQTIYKYYGSKEALLFSCLDYWLNQLVERMLDHLQGIEDTKGRLRKVFWLTLDFFERNPRVMQLMTSSIYLNSLRQAEAFQNPQLFGTFLKVLAEGRASGELTDEVDEIVLLDYIFGVLSRLVMMYVQRGRQKPPSQQANVLFEMLWRSIARPRS